LKLKKTTFDERKSALDLLPNVAFMQCREVVEEAIGEAGKIMLTAILQASADTLTGPSHRGRKAEIANVRHGTQPGSVFLGTSKVSVERPRVRSGIGKGAKEVVIPAYEMLKSDEGACKKVHKAVLSGLSTRKFKAALSSGMEAAGVSKSSISRRAIKEGSRQLEEFTARAVPSDLVAMLLDGTHLDEYCFVTAIGIDSKGGKHALGIAEGTTENSAVASDLLKNLRDRGLDFGKKLLFVTDGSKALRAAIREVCGSHHPIQRCRVHKKENVLSRLPESKREYFRSLIMAAWKLPPEQGFQQMKRIAAELRVSHPDAANSLLEGLEETFTVNRLGLSPDLVTSLATTNLIENPHGAIKNAMRRTKSYKNIDQAKRWLASVLLEAEQNFRTLKGHKDIWMLEAALGQYAGQEAV
jgi:putative transposase